MKGQLNVDGFVMDFGDVKRVPLFLFVYKIVCTSRMQETQPTFFAAHEE